MIHQPDRDGTATREFALLDGAHDLRDALGQHGRGVLDRARADVGSGCGVLTRFTATSRQICRNVRAPKIGPIEREAWIERARTIIARTPPARASEV